MSFGIGAYEVGEAGHCSSMKRRYFIHGNPASDPHPTAISLVLEREGPVNNCEMGPLTPTTPKHQALQLYRKSRLELTK